jgi:ABC-type multidrug transport system fused ATPase/permease subunit
MERIHEYLGVQQEPKDGIRPPAAWPSKEGTIEVEGLTARYAPHLPPVLKSVSFSVKAGEKIGESMQLWLHTFLDRSTNHGVALIKSGICGRTGSGKSTLALSFFRFIEAEAGRIFIDGLDISKLDLASLRSRLTIIPQESVLFSA